jgi:hypothetical protein
LTDSTIEVELEAEVDVGLSQTNVTIYSGIDKEFTKT